MTSTSTGSTLIEADELAARYRSQGLKITAQRRAIFAAIAGKPAHWTAEDVFALAKISQPSLSLRTVYQTLNDLVAVGGMQRIELGVGSARFDTTLGTHHHLVCESCGVIIDVPVDVANVQFPAGIGESFDAHSAEIVFRGRCVPACETDRT